MVKFISEIIKSDVILFQEMVRIGKIEEVIIAKKDGSFLGFTVDVPGDNRYIPVSEIKGFGKSAVMVKEFNSLSQAQDIVKIKESLPAPQIIGAKVVDEEGNNVGKVTDATINLSLLSIEKLYIKPPLSFKMLTDSLIIPAKNIIKIETKKIVIRANGKVKSGKTVVFPAPLTE